MGGRGFRSFGCVHKKGNRRRGKGCIVHLCAYIYPYMSSILVFVLLSSSASVMCIFTVTNQELCKKTTGEMRTWSAWNYLVPR